VSAVPADRSGSDGYLTAFRVLAIVVGVGLLVLVLVGMPLKYAADKPIVVDIVGPAHGVLYVLYFLLALQLWLRERWSLRFALPVLCAGIVPFLSFYAERQVTRRVRAGRSANT
jgi:integral membrane protein